MRVKNLDDFMIDIAKQESGLNYSAVNRFGYLGAYQFGKARLLDLGISIDNYGRLTHPLLYRRAKKITKEEFLKDKELQDYVFVKHCLLLVKNIRKELSSFYNTKFEGVILTESGLVAGAHLVGYGGLKKFLFSKKDVRDGNNVSVKTYIDKFKNYKLDESNKQWIKELIRLLLGS